MNSDNGSNSLNLKRILLLAGIILFAGVFLYHSSLASLAYAVIYREGSSHGIFVPFLCVFFIWIKRDILCKTEIRYDLLGMPILLIGLLVPIFITEPFNLQILGFIILISGAAVILLGRKFFKEITFPLLFLITLIPLTDGQYSDLADKIKFISFGSARWIISMLGFPFLRNGDLLYLHNATLDVAEGCSGIRYLVSYFVFSLAYAYLFKKAFWSRLVVILSSIIISLMASVGRLTFIFILTHLFGPQMAEYWPHVIISWSVFIIVLILAIIFDQYFLGGDARKPSIWSGLKACRS